MKVLALDFGGVLDGIFSLEKPSDNDLVLDQVGDDLFQVLKNGVTIVELLNALVTEHRYKLVAHAKGKEAEQLTMINKLNQACLDKGLDFPRFIAIAVRDPVLYKGINSSAPILIKNRTHGIWIAGYGQELEDKACVRNALSKLLNISEESRKRHLIVDDSSLIIEQAKFEGWQGYQVGDVTLFEVISKIYEDAQDEETSRTNLESTKDEGFLTQRSESSHKKIAEAHWGQISSQVNENKGFFGVPAKNDFCVGREQELKKVNEMLNTNRIACITGPAGIGKSNLAVEYAYQSYRKKYMQVIWLYAEHINLISTQMQAYLEITTGRKLEETTQDKLTEEFYTIISKNTACVIIDSAHDFKSIEVYLPKELSRTDILITSQNNQWNFPILSLNVFNSQITFLYLEKRLGKVFIEKEAGKFNKLLNGLPLAISQAIGYMRETGVSLSDYCTLFEKEQALILSQAYPADLQAVATTFNLTLNELKQKVPQINTILSFAAYLSGDDITLPLFESFCNNKADSAVQLLSDYSLLSSGQGKLKIHQATQRIIRTMHKNTNSLEKEHKKAMEWFLPILSYDHQDPQQIAQISALIPHGLVLGEIENAQIDFVSWEKFWFKLGRHERQIVKNLQTSKFCLEKALMIAEKNFGEDHLETSFILTDLALVYGSLGDYNKQKDLLTRAFNIKEKRYGKGYSETGVALSMLANVHGSLGEYEKQRDLLIQALAIKEKHYGIVHPETSATLTDLANAYGSLGEHEKQRDLLAQALVIQEEYFDKDLEKSTISNISSTSQLTLKDLEGTFDYQMRAHAKFIKFYGPSHQYTRNSLQMLEKSVF